MSSAADEPQQSLIGPGALIAVCGPSGAGKDLLLRRVQEMQELNNDMPRIVFPRRIVTRPVSSFEDHDSATPDAFDQLLAGGRLALWWAAHGLKYGLPGSIDDDIRAGRCVACNGSRMVVPALRHRYAHVVIVLITAPPDILAARLAARARATDGGLPERMARSSQVSEDLKAEIVIDNTGSIDDGARQLYDAIESRLTMNSKV